MKSLRAWLCPWLLFSAACVAAPSARVFYVNSYHAGYPPSDEVMAGLRDTLGAAGVELRTAFLDAKRADPAVVTKTAEALRAEIEAFRPAVLIVSDDNAVQSLVVPFYRRGALPVVFCGVNWSCDAYGLPTPNVTGMLERVPVIETIEAVAALRPTRTLTILSEDSASEQANRRILDPLFRARGLVPTWRLVTTFKAWQEAFVAAAADSDLIYLSTNGAIRGWDAGAAESWVKRHAKVPVITCDDFMMRYAMFGMTKVAREQGEWAAQTALAFIRGEKTPADVPVTGNRQSSIWFNPALAETIGFELPEPLRSRARVR